MKKKIDGNLQSALMRLEILHLMVMLMTLKGLWKINENNKIIKHVEVKDFLNLMHAA
jgi:hypothetical protein